MLIDYMRLLFTLFVVKAVLQLLKILSEKVLSFNGTTPTKTRLYFYYFLLSFRLLFCTVLGDESKTINIKKILFRA